MARAMWSGSITFGLVNVPVKLYPAVRDRSVHFHLLSKDGRCRLRRKLVCPETGEEVQYSETSRGYEIAPDQYVVIDNEELDSLKPKGERAIEISDFVDLADIDPVYYNRPYYLAPDQSGAKAYALLFTAMQETRKVGIARFVMRRKEYLAAVRPIEGGLCLETMNFDDEVESIRELSALPGDDAKPAKRELEVARQLIKALAGPFQPQQYHEEYRERVMQLIERKAAGEQVITHAPSEEESPRVINLMEALEESLKRAKKPPARRRRKSA